MTRERIPVLSQIPAPFSLCFEVIVDGSKRIYVVCIHRVGKCMVGYRICTR